MINFKGTSETVNPVKERNPFPSDVPDIVLVFTNGTAYYTISDDEVNSLFMSHKSVLQDEKYFDAFYSILEDLTKHEYSHSGLYFAYFLIVIIPLALAALITGLIKPHHKLDPKPHYRQYTKEKLNNGSECKLVNRSVRVVYHNESSGSSSGGGFSGGGGGGGGHSGGGGGFF